MATDGKTNRWNGVAYQAADERLMDSPLLMPGPSAEPFSARGGRRVNGAGLAVSIGTGPDSWTVTPGAGVIYDSTLAAQGAWRFEIPASVTANFPARPGAGQSRIDLIVARIYDSDIPLGAVKEVKIERVNGTAGASPSAPALPALSLLLATVTVPNSGSITVAAATAKIVAAGGILPVATTAERDALPNPWRGLVVDNAQTGKLERYDGTAWSALSAEVTPHAAGSDVTPTIAATNTTYLKAITFPVGRFAAPPIVVPTFIATVGSTVTTVLWSQDVTTSGANIGIRRSSTGAGIPFGWIAVEPD